VSHETTATTTDVVATGMGRAWTAAELEALTPDELVLLLDDIDARRLRMLEAVRAEGRAVKAVLNHKLRTEAFLAKLGGLPAGQAAEMVKLLAADPEAAAKLLAEARRVREAIIVRANPVTVGTSVK
jgi:hypothetical protein